MRSGSSSRIYSPTMVSNGRDSRARMQYHPLRGHYARRNPDDDDLGDLSPGSSSESEIEVAPSSEKRKAGRPKGSKKSVSASKAATGEKRGRGRPPKAIVEGEKKKATAKTLTAKSAEKHLTDILKMVRGLERLSSVDGKVVVSGGRVHYPALKIQVVGSGSGKKKAASGVSRKRAATHINEMGVKVFTASGKAAGKPKKVAIAANGRVRMLRNPDDVAVKSKHQKAKIGPYQLTLLKNPIVDFKIGGVKVVPAVAGTIGTVALSQFIKNLPIVSGMAPGVLKNIIPSAVTVAIGALAYGYCKKNNQPLFAEMAENVVAFGMAFGVNEVVEKKVEELVGKIKMHTKTTAATTTTTTTAAPTTATTTTTAAPTTATTTSGLGSGRFMRQRDGINGGGWVPPVSGLHGYINRPLGSAAAPGYAPFQLQGGEGSSGYPDFQNQLAAYADSAETARSLMNGGQFARESKPTGIDLSGFAD